MATGGDTAARRRQLAEAAAARFHRLGFPRVALADVAADIGVTAPAVYRYFRSKNALLAGAVATGLDHVEEVLSRAGSLDAAVDGLADAALRRRDVWTLLQREVRHLDDHDRAVATARFRGLVDRFSVHVATARPDLDHGQVQVLVTGAFAVLASPSTQPVPLPHEDYRRLLARAAAAVCAVPLPPPAPAGPPAPAPPRADLPRGEQVFASALALFHRNGYAAVSMDDIGAAVGIAGPSLYHHVATKSQLLLAACDRAAAHVPTPHHAAPAPVRDLVERYAAFAVRERDLLGVYVTEAVNVPAAAAGRVAAAARADVGRWVGVLREERPELGVVHAELLVHAARSAVHDIARIGRLHRRGRITDEIVAVATAALACPALQEATPPGVAVRRAPAVVRGPVARPAGRS